MFGPNPRKKGSQERFGCPIGDGAAPFFDVVIPASNVTFIRSFESFVSNMWGFIIVFSVTDVCS